MSVIFEHEKIYAIPPMVGVHVEAWESLPADEEKLLQQIIKAIQLPLDAVRILPSAYKPAQLSHCIVFTASPEGEYYQPMEHQHVSTIFSKPLSELKTLDNDRKLLWQGLKKMFAL